MDKKELINLSEKFMQEAFQANCYYDITKQYSENVKEYEEEIRFSSAFYTYTYNALVVATFLELAKIYDSHRMSVNIMQLMDNCEEQIALFPQRREFKVIIEGKEIIENFPYNHIVSSDEEDFFRKEVEGQKSLNELVGITDLPVNVEMTLERYFELYKWKYRRIEPQIKNLLGQRNKVYAHNDEKSLDNIEEVISNLPLNRRDLESLISFALEFCQFVIALLTGVNKAKKPVNINDWKGTLTLVRLGNKYKDMEIEENVKKSMKKHYPEME